MAQEELERSEKGEGRAVDPVLVRLRDWASTQGLTREAISRRLGVSRPAVAGWFLRLEASVTGKQSSRSARGFTFTTQRPEVQQAIADMLELPVATLRAESLSVVRGRARPLPGVDLGPLTTAAPPNEVFDIASSLLGELAAGSSTSGALGPTGGGTLRHRAAEVVESVDGVVASAVVAEPRGRDRAQPYQHQVVVFVDAPDQRRGEGADVYSSRMRDEIDFALARASLPLYWEHDVKEPDASITFEGRPLMRLGSLVCPLVSASRRPRKGLLVPPHGEVPIGQQLRLAALVTNPYGGSDPIGGHTAEALGAGHVRAVDVIRAVRDTEARRRGGISEDRVAFLSADAEREAGFVVHQALHVLQLGKQPGAWLLSMEVQTIAGDRPLQDALVHLDGVLVIVHLATEWRRMAAWRCAAGDLNSAAQVDGATEPASSDHLNLAPGTLLDADALAVLRRHEAAAEDWRLQLDEWEDTLDELERRRTALSDRPTIRLTLDHLPDDRPCIRYDDGPCRPVLGSDRFTGSVVFPDAVDGLMDAWVEMSAEVVERLAGVAGHPNPPTPELVDRLAPGPTARILDARIGVGRRA